MSSKKQLKSRQTAQARDMDDDNGPSTSGKVQKSSDSKRSMFTGKSNKPKPAREEAPAAATDLARLLGNYSRSLLLFENEDFDAEAFIADYFKGLSEKGIDNARHDLGALLSQCVEEVETVVYDHHHAFLEACKGVEDLEDKVQLLRHYVNGQAVLINNLKQAKGTGKEAQQAGRESLAPFPSHALPVDETPSTVRAIEQQLEQLMQELDVAVAERDLDTARSVLQVGTDALAVLDRDADVLALEVADFPSWRHHFESQIGARKQQLTRVLERQLSDASASPAEIRAATRALGHLVGESHAAAVMLNCYGQKIRALQALLLRQHSSVGADPDSSEYAGGLVQRSLLEIARAADDCVVIFGVSSKHVAALFTVWAVKEAKAIGAALRRNVLSAHAAAAGGLAPTMQCVSLAMVFCSALEGSHQISLTSAVIAELWPHVEAVLKRSIKRFGDELRMLAAEEADTLVLQCLTGTLPRVGNAPDAPPRVSLLTGASLTGELRVLAETLAPLAGARLAGALKKGVQELFAGYTQAIGTTLKSHMQATASNAQRLQPLLPAMMECLAGMIEEGIPEALAPFTSIAGPIVDGKMLDKSLNAMYRDCQSTTRAARAAAAAASAAGTGEQAAAT